MGNRTLELYYFVAFGFLVTVFLVTADALPESFLLVVTFLVGVFFVAFAAFFADILAVGFLTTTFFFELFAFVTSFFFPLSTVAFFRGFLTFTASATSSISGLLSFLPLEVEFVICPLVNKVVE